jgi:hypothetical protein
MPRTSRVRTTSAIEEVQKQIRQLLSNLGSQIRSTEADLRRLKTWPACSGPAAAAG